MLCLTTLFAAANYAHNFIFCLITLFPAAHDAILWALVTKSTYCIGAGSAIREQSLTVTETVLGNFHAVREQRLTMTLAIYLSV